MMDYETPQAVPPCSPDLWDFCESLGFVGAGASLFCTFASENPKLKKSFGTACAVLGAVGIVARAVTPPKCQQCCVRSVIDGTNWVCPNCQGIIGKVWLLPPLS